MLPTLSVNDDWILTSKYHRRGRGVRVGDVVDFAHPLVVGEGAVKRVVGMPGDFVVADGWGGGVRGGMIQVGGEVFACGVVWGGNVYVG